MKLRTVLVIGAVLFAVLKAKNPRWYEDLMLRGYAKDQVPPRELTPEQQQKLQIASAASSAVGLPVGWILEIAYKVDPKDVPVLAKRVAEKVKSMGPPKLTTPEALAEYKAQALAAAGV
jgi:hypothetical protein